MLSESDEEAVRCAERLIEEMLSLSRVLEKRAETLRQAIEFRVPVADYSAALKGAQVSEDREDLNEALFRLEQRRRESRIASFRSALDHGVSISELARLWGFSRQMASRYAKEARGEI
jgi:hypothetical protein